MPWTPKDSARHTAKAKSQGAKAQWASVANNVLEETHDEGRAVRTANAVVKKRTEKRKSSSHD